MYLFAPKTQKQGGACKIRRQTIGMVMPYNFHIVKANNRDNNERAGRLAAELCSSKS